MVLLGYALVCLCVLVFNLAWVFVRKEQNHWTRRRSLRYASAIRGQLNRILAGQDVERRYLRRLRRELTSARVLISFERALRDPRVTILPEALDQFLCQLEPLLLETGLHSLRKDELQCAWFAFFLAEHRRVRYREVDAIQDLVLEYIKRNSLYCRVNALNALYAFGTPEYIACAIELMGRLGSTLHGKILTEGILTYTGDHGRLIQVLWDRYHAFTDAFKLPVLNYIRFKSGAYQERMYAILTDPACDRELRLSAMRYLGKYPYPPAREALLGFLKDQSPEKWEYAAVSAFCLSSYPGEDVTAALKDALRSFAWHVRFNAAESLGKRGLSRADFAEILDGPDRYAREMMLYRLGALEQDGERTGQRQKA